MNHRLLYIYSQLLQRKVVKKKEICAYFSVNERTVQRDLSTLKTFLSLHFPEDALLYKRSLNGYVLESSGHLNKEHLLLLSKILLESRSLTKKEVKAILNQLVVNLDPVDQKELYLLYGNELNHYIGPKHNKELSHLVWEITEKIAAKKTIKILYIRSDKQIKTYYLEPQSVIFSDFYFYLTAYNIKKKQVNTYRVDRILAIENAALVETDSHTSLNMADSDFRKHAHLMQIDQLVTVTIEFTGTLEALLDKFPNHEVLEPTPNGTPTIKLTAYHKGLEMWLLSQRDLVKIIGPESFKQAYLATIEKMLTHYN